MSCLTWEDHICQKYPVFDKKATYAEYSICPPDPKDHIYQKHQAFDEKAVCAEFSVCQPDPKDQISQKRSAFDKKSTVSRRTTFLRSTQHWTKGPCMCRTHISQEYLASLKKPKTPLPHSPFSPPFPHCHHVSSLNKFGHVGSPCLVFPF